METVGGILARNPVWEGEGVPDAPIAQTLPARHPDQPDFPTLGIYFDMPEADYHAINAFSASLAKKLAISTMDAWACSPLNLEREDDDTGFKELGRAYHVRICEGAAVYAERYAIALDRKDYPDALVTVDQIKAAIIDAGETPASRIPTGQMKPAPIKSDPDRMAEVTRAASKDDWIAQLYTINSGAQIWDALIDAHAAANEGKAFIAAKQDRRIQIAARMIEADPELRKAFTGGYAEVAIFWFDEKSGCPCKAKLDYLKLLAFVDLKSFSNSMGRPVSRAIDYTIAGQHHYIAVMHYRDAVEAAKQLIRSLGESAIHGTPEQVAWAHRLAKQQDAPTALYVYQQTGEAPVTRGREMVIGTTATITAAYLQTWRRRYVECTKAYGVDPWVDIAPIEQTVDESIPLSATDLGDDSGK